LQIRIIVYLMEKFMEKYNPNSFREFLINEKSIPLKNVRFYQVWVDRFLSYYQKNLKAVKYNWIFHISAGEFCDAAQEALLSLQRQAVIVFSQAMGNTIIARIETATAQIIYGV